MESTITPIPTIPSPHIHQENSLIPCTICNLLLHDAPPCPHRSNKPPSYHTTNPAYLSALLSPPPSSQPTTHQLPPPLTSTNWFLDSGASAHLTNHYPNLILPQPYLGHDTITVGNGSQLPITHTGHHTLTTPQGNLHLPNLLYVPTLHHNLLSIYHLTSTNNCRIIFDSDGYTIQDKTTNHILHQGPAVNGLYPFTSSTFSYSATSTPHNLWHSRLGHPHPDILHFLSNTIPEIPSSRLSPSCNACGVSKSHKLSFPTSSIKTSHPFELIHSDVWGPSPNASHQGLHYYLLFIDDFTRYTWLFPLQSKSDTFQHFKHFHTMVKTQFNMPIKALRTDH